MNVAPALVGYTAAVGFAAPRIMLRSRWPYRAPALATAVWQSLAISFSIAVALTVCNLAMPIKPLVGILDGWTVGTGVGRLAPDIGSHLGANVSAAIGVTLIASFAFHLTRARRARTRHQEAVDLVGRHSAQLGAIVLSHDAPAAYCLPGRRPRIVITDATVRQLTPEQLGAVLQHEQGHIRGRHHLPLAAMQAFRSIFRWVPLARHAQEQTTLLLEMIADDRALSSHSHEVLATAMYEMAAARAPKGALAAGGNSAVIRIQRVLDSREAPHPVLRGSLAVMAVTIPLLPLTSLLIACSPALG
ncbi:M56 family metallopeptidase [Streptomyces sp. CA-106110]|uniref:M56 family metallopeptidase n=1 Tax=Streptomyces sp. CA-106110 TaxID=3240044 RepID=UPI003D8E50B3